MNTEDIATHTNPVWRDKANFIIFADLTDHSSNNKWEQLWAEQIKDNEFKICCIPFFTYNLSLGDLVRTKPSMGKNYVIDKVIEPSNHKTFRVWFGDSTNSNIKESFESFILDQTWIYEWSSDNLIAIDVTSTKASEKIEGFLNEMENNNSLIYERGWD